MRENTSERVNTFSYKPGNSIPFGVTKVSDGVQFAVYLPDCTQCKLNLYKKGQKKPECSISLTGQYRRGSVFFVTLTGKKGKQAADLAQILSKNYEYMYEADGEEIMDPYAAIVHGREHWGKNVNEEEGKGLRSGISLESFDWEDDSQKNTSYSDLILYQLHVRGFTKHASSKVAHKGTFSGVTEKIPYLKELGINGVMLLPCYEFNEILRNKPMGQPQNMAAAVKAVQAEKQQTMTKEEALAKVEARASASAKQKPEVKLNYWGYGSLPTFYFAPKASYAAKAEQAVEEMKTMVHTFHKNGIEVLMDIYFSPGSNMCMMTDCLRHWVMEYHIDGFRVNQEVMPALVMASDPILSGVKLLSAHWDTGELSRAGLLHKQNALAEYNEGFMQDVRRFLKSDEGCVEGFVYRFRHNPKDFASINFITHVNGFTLMDLVSYDIKHNEANGEMNQDGTEYNYSWNCGAEGRSRKKAIVSRRMTQIRNAFLMLLLSQGTPMILAGDEFGNSQNGNNNPYCQDNAITWLNWNQCTTHKDILDYVKKLIAFRKDHPVLHQPEELKMYDTLSTGIPDLSAHSVETWKPDYSNYNRMLGLLLYGDYARKADGTADESMYIIYNMFWEPKSFDLPDLPGEREWYVVIETYGNTFEAIPEVVPKKKKTKKTKLLKNCKKTIVPPRSIVVFAGK